jgi:hypothetical protein
VNEFPTTFAAAAFPSLRRRGMAFERHSSSFIHTFIDRAVPSQTPNLRVPA